MDRVWKKEEEATAIQAWSLETAPAETQEEEGAVLTMQAH
jgi:hypothetical protein